MLQAIHSLRDEYKTIKKSSKAGVDHVSALDPMPETSKQNDNMPLYPNIKPSTQQLNYQAYEDMDEPKETDFCGPFLPTQFGQSVQSEHGSDLNRLDQTSNIPTNPNGCAR